MVTLRGGWAPHALVDEAALRNATVVVERQQHLLQHGARRVVKEAVHAVRGQLLQLGLMNDV